MRTLDDLTHDELAVLVREFLLAGHLIDRAGMPQVIPRGIDVMRDVAIDEWMGASPVYTKRMQRLLAFEGDTVEVAFKGMQLDIGAPPEFLDFRYEIADDHHGSFHLAHCGALMDVEPMGEEFVVAMCHHIEDPTFDATAWATNPRMRMRPLHRPPREPSNRVPHCEWTVVVDPDAEPTPEPAAALRMGRTRAARMPLATYPATGDGAVDYSGPLAADLSFSRFSTATIRAILDEVALQGHLLAMAFGAAVEDRLGTEAAAAAVVEQGTGAAGVAAGRLARALGLGPPVGDLATLLMIHPAFLPRSYIDWSVQVDRDTVHLRLGECPAIAESGFESWITTLAAGHGGLLSAIASALDPRWVVRPDTSPWSWRVEWNEAALGTAVELPAVSLAELSAGTVFEFIRPV